MYNQYTINVTFYCSSKIITFLQTFFPVFQVAGRRIYFIQYYKIHNCIIEFTNILYYLTN